MSKYFNNAKQWSEQVGISLGLPRPFVIVPKDFKAHPSKNLTLKNNFYLHPKIPIPWQSKPVLAKDGGVFNVIEKHEQMIYKKDLCGYCGINIKNDEQSIRWIGNESPYIPNDKQGPRVFSDTHPLHIECMKQARIFCPYMRERPTSEFETGVFSILKQHANNDIK